MRFLRIPGILCAGSIFFGILALTGPASSQISGSTAGVPVPKAPMASDQPRKSPDIAPGSKVFRVKVVDGRNGLPLVNAHLKLWYDDGAGNGYFLATNSEGIALMPEPIRMPIRVLIRLQDKMECRKLDPHEPLPGYNMQQVAEKGIAMENRCGQITIKRDPGELIVYGRAPRWYESLNQQ